MLYLSKVWAGSPVPAVVALGFVVAMAACAQPPKPPAAANKPGAAATEPGGLDEGLPPMVRTPWTGDLDEMAKRRLIRVLLPFRRPEFFYVDGRPVGILQEAFQELERVVNLKYKTTAANRIVIALIPTPMDQIRSRMIGKMGDIAAFGISITSQNKAAVDFTAPTMTGVKMMVLSGPGAPALAQPEDLSGKEIWLMPGTRMKNDLDAFNAKLTSQGKAPVKARYADPVLEPGDIVEMVNAGLYPIALMQSVQAGFWTKVFPEVKANQSLVLGEASELGWAIPKGTPQLKALLDDFLKTHGVGTAFGNTLVRRYLTDVKYVRNATETSELQKFRSTAPIFQKYSSKYDLDYLMMIAQGYQESGLNQKVKSPVGAVGIMQVMPTTAASAPVNIPNITTEDGNIHAGMRLMHFLVEEHFNEPGLDRMNKILFALAAYNAGPARVRKCRAMAKDAGYDPNKWFGNVEVSMAKVVGRETTQYVANIYKYYLAYTLAAKTGARRTAVSEQLLKGAPVKSAPAKSAPAKAGSAGK